MCIVPVCTVTKVATMADIVEAQIIIKVIRVDIIRDLWHRMVMVGIMVVLGVTVVIRKLVSKIQTICLINLPFLLDPN